MLNVILKKMKLLPNERMSGARMMRKLKKILNILILILFVDASGAMQASGIEAGVDNAIRSMVQNCAENSVSTSSGFDESAFKECLKDKIKYNNSDITMSVFNKCTEDDVCSEGIAKGMQKGIEIGNKN